MAKTKGDWVDFKEVKLAVSMEMVLGYYGIEIRKVNGSSWRGKCPLPAHTGDSESSFSVNTDKNAWACHVGSCVKARDGRKGGNVLDFVAVMEGCSVRDAALKLQNWFSVEASNERPSGYVPSRDRTGKPKEELTAIKKDETEEDSSSDVEDEAQQGKANQPLEFELQSIDTTHPYIRSRGIKEGIAQHFGIGFFYGKGSMAERLVIPIHNEKGELIAYAGRAVDDEIEPKYKFPAGFKKSLVLFNLHRVMASKSLDRDVIVVEGFFDCMKIHQAGFPNVVALMGSSLSPKQKSLLFERFVGIISMLDGDEVGKSAISEITLQLTEKCFVRVVRVPDGKQPDQLSSGEIQKLLSFLEHSELTT